MLEHDIEPLDPAIHTHVTDQLQRFSLYVNVAVTVGWNMVEYTTTEAQGGVEVCIDLVAGTLERSVEIDVLSMDGSATGNEKTCLSV